MITLLQTAILEHQRKEHMLRNVKSHFEKVRIHSKNAIALLRRDHTDQAQALLQKAEEILREMHLELGKNPHILNQGFYAEALEEYVEAKFFAQFLLNQPHQFPEFVIIDASELMSGMCDFTGELVRRATSIASPQNIKTIEHYQTTIEEIIQELTQVGFRRKLRQKYDETERNLKRIESILYDIRLLKHKENS